MNIQKMMVAFLVGISVNAMAEQNSAELKTMECFASPSMGTAGGTRYLRYKKYAGENSNKLSQDQDIQIVVGNWGGESAEMLSLRISKVEKWGHQYFVDATSTSNSNKEIRILLEQKNLDPNKGNPFEYSGWIHSLDSQLNGKIESSLNCSVYDGEAN